MSDTLGYLYRNIIHDEKTCVQFLQDRDLIATTTENKRCIKVRNNKQCGGTLKECERKSKKRNEDGTLKKYISLKCSKKGCQTHRSIRNKNSFFTYMSLNARCHSNLLLTEIMELVWYWVHLVPVHQVVQFTGRNIKTVINWFNLCRDVTSQRFENRSQIGGQDLTVEIDQSLFREKRKTNKDSEKGLIQCDIQQKVKQEIKQEIKQEFEEDQIEIVTISLPGCSPVQNYEKQVTDGPWIFRLSCEKDGIFERRIFIVSECDSETLIPLIKNEVKLGTTIYSDKSEAYLPLKYEGYIHNIVNIDHLSEDPYKNTSSSLGCYWKMLKKRYEIKTNETPHALSRQLKEEWWRSLHPNKKTIFDEFLNDMRETFST